MIFDRPVKKKLLGDTAVAAKWVPFAMQKVRQLLAMELTPFSKNFELDDATIRIWDDPANIYVTVEGKSDADIYFWVVKDSPATYALAKYQRGLVYKRTSVPSIFDFESDTLAGGATKAAPAVFWAENDALGQSFIKKYDLKTKAVTNVYTWTTGTKFLNAIWSIGQDDKLLTWWDESGPITFKLLTVSTGVLTAITSPPSYGTPFDSETSFVVTHTGRWLAYFDGADGSFDYSDDLGTTWHTVSPFSSAGTLTGQVVFVPHSLNVVFAATFTALNPYAAPWSRFLRIWKSEDDGLSWTQVYEYRIDSSDSFNFVINGGFKCKDNIVFPHDDYTVFSIDGGNTWDKVKSTTVFPGLIPVTFGGSTYATSTGLLSSTFYPVGDKFLANYRDVFISSTEFLKLFRVSAAGPVAVGDVTDTAEPLLWKKVGIHDMTTSVTGVSPPTGYLF